MMFFLPFIAKYVWLSPLSHFITSAIAGTLAFYMGNFIFKQKKTCLALAIFVGIATHIFFDFLGWF